MCALSPTAPAEGQELVPPFLESKQLALHPFPNSVSWPVKVRATVVSPSFYVITGVN